MHHSAIHSVLIVMFLNSLILFVAACLKTIPSEAVSIAGQLDNAPLRRMPVLPAQDDYSAHIQQFRQAKTFPSPQPIETATSASASNVKRSSSSSDGDDFTVSDKSVEAPRVASREGSKKNAKTFAVKTNTRSETKGNENENVSHPEPAVSHRDSNNVHDDRDLFEALQVEKPDICGSCPPLWMKNTAEMKDICSNHESVSTFFSMTMDKRDAQNIVDTSDLKECTRTITCTEPHMLVKWYESELCDVHAPYSGSLITDSSNTFIYKCNGTQWTLHGFPLSSVVCAVSSN
ncbi:hypothetical protein L5515_011825 [Caenorhabditis briggsae]|uniref:Uncharacterized protein n=1 Tax=Caenorhabditis briggsae TaxID=6238 RepID=A0AAE9EQY2_CAEBR|nr:hypothetical protein L5515_011825 [Caenorhabditis briggsae]